MIARRGSDAEPGEGWGRRGRSRKKGGDGEDGREGEKKKGKDGGRGEKKGKRGGWEGLKEGKEDERREDRIGKGKEN